MKVRQKEIFTQLSATFATSMVENWTAKVTHWETDPSSPNPYEEPESSKINLLRDLRPELSVSRNDTTGCTTSTSKAGGG